jgi:hypothetical protein
MEQETASIKPALSPTAAEPAPATNLTPSVLAPTQTPRVTPAQPSGFSVGISMGETLSFVSTSKLNATLDDIASLGVDWIRVDCSWNTIQPNDSSSFSWEAFDRIVESANERGIHVLPILTYTPRWARSPECVHTSKCHPDNTEEFAEFARAAVQRYASKGIDAWEIWNEPNMGIFWAPHADPEQYTELLTHAHEAIKDMAPSATVITGGLAPVESRGINMSALDFTERMYLEGAKEHFDALGYHPYTYPASPSIYDKHNAWSQMDETPLSLRGIMKYNDDGEKNIWLTEYGAPTGGPGSPAHDADYGKWRVPSHVTESYQAELLKSALEEARDLDFIGPLFWYSYQDLGTDEEDRENFFGLRRYDGSVKASYTTLRQLIN